VVADRGGDHPGATGPDDPGRVAAQDMVQLLGRGGIGPGSAPAGLQPAPGSGADWFWSYAPALVGDDFRPLSGPDPGGPAYGNLLVSRLSLAAVEHLRFPPAGGGEQRTALLATIPVGSRPVTVAATHLSNKQGHNVRQLRELQGLAGSRAAPRLLVGDLNLPSTVLLFASRRAITAGWSARPLRASIRSTSCTASKSTPRARTPATTASRSTWLVCSRRAPAIFQVPTRQAWHRGSIPEHLPPGQRQARREDPAVEPSTARGRR
jgi:hypothetical protein